MIRLRLCIFGVTTPEVMLCPSQCLVAGDKVNFDHMAEMVCVGFLHYQIINFAFEIGKNLTGRYLEVVQKSYLPLEFCSLILASSNGSYLSKYYCSICLMITICFLIPSIFIHWYSVRKTCLFSSHLFIQ